MTPLRIINKQVLNPGKRQTPINRELLKGCCMVIFFTLFPLICTWITVRLPDVFLLPGVIVALLCGVVVYLLAVADAFRTERKDELFKTSYQSGFSTLLLTCVTLLAK